MAKKPDASSGGYVVLVAAGLLAAVGGAPVAAQTTPWRTIAHWRMDETTGDLMRNSVPNSPDGVWHAIIPGRIGFRGRAYGFNGFSSYVEVPHAPIFNFGMDSIRVTVRVRTTVPGTSLGGNDLIKKGYSESSPLFKMEFYPDGRVSCAFKGTKARTGDMFSLSSVVTRLPPAYRTVECVLDQAAKQARVVVDGVTEATRPADLGPIFSTDPVVIGAYPGSGFYRGTLDEVMIQTAACSPAQCPIDGLEYIATYPDLIQAFGADAAAGQAHYLNHGRAEGRVPYGFNPVQYLTNYADLQAAFGSDTQSALVHYIQYGFAEGRTDLAQ
jgi:Concanavalin A-like lectin/glucanases superfamily